MVPRARSFIKKKNRRSFLLRTIAVAFSICALVGVSQVPAHALSVIFNANMAVQTAYAGEPIKPVWFSVYVKGEKTTPSFSVSTNLPRPTLVTESSMKKGIIATLPEDVKPGVYGVTARVVVDGEVRYARSSIRVLKERNHEHPQIFEGYAKDIAAGNYQTCVVTRLNEVKCWGRNTSGQVGQSPDYKVVSRPKTVPGLSYIKKVSAGNAFSCALREDGRVLCWGDNSQNQLGYGGISQSHTPVRVQGLPSTIVDIQSGSAHSCALASNGEAYCWGSSIKGQLGNGTAGFSINQAVRVSGGHKWKSLAAGGFHTCGITTGGDAYCWGQNNLHQLGSLQSTSQHGANPLPKKADTNSKYLSVHTGYDFSCAIKTNRRVDCWGSNSKGQVGADLPLGPRSDAKKPTEVKYIYDIYQLDTGYYHACSLDGRGNTQCWGEGTYSKLGKSGTSNRSYPVDTRFGKDYGYPALLAAGASHSCFISFDGDVLCWGNQANGQLGDGTQYDETSTTQYFSTDPVEPYW